MLSVGLIVFRVKLVKSVSGQIFRNLLFLFLLNFIIVESYSSELTCGKLEGVGFGPFNYNDPEARHSLWRVENVHFKPEVENLIRGSTSATPLGDLDYTLRAFPNHHRALYAFSKYEIQEIHKSQLRGLSYKPPKSEAGFPATAACYFDRAIRWRPNDPNVRLIYGIHLHKIGKSREALDQYKISEKIQPNSAELNYNMGLLYFDLKQYSLAKQYAKKAYQLGYPLPGLRKKLASVRQWP